MIRRQDIGVELESPKNDKPRYLRDPSITAMILIVEDSKTTRVLMEKTLKSLGFSYRSVENGKIAVDKIAAGERYLLILMDKEMVSANSHHISLHSSSFISACDGWI